MQRPESIRFADATLSLLNKTFRLTQDFDRQLPSFLEWQGEMQKVNITEHEKGNLLQLQKPFIRRGRVWNEVELESKFIAPLLGFTEIEDEMISYFMERSLESFREGVKLYGIVDGIIALGISEPEKPFFCLQEYKRTKDHSGDADAQTLASMLAAQSENEESIPTYGLFVIGVSWNFMILEGKEYTISKTYAADGESIFDIFKMLKALKVLIKRNLSGLS